MSKPILTTLSDSEGVQSHLILEMILRGDMERPDPFVVLNADPGMEDERTYGFVKSSRERCKAAGIDFITVDGPNLRTDLLTFKERGVTRIDNPPYWTKNRITGKKGRMRQKCTQAYKIAPMRRALRKYLNEKFGISLVSNRLPKVQTWIGFAADESDRVSESDVKYIELAFPLIEAGMTKHDCTMYYIENGIDLPPRSVCSACFSNGLAYFQDMYLNRPNDWDTACEVDDAVRDMRSVGIEDEVFVCQALVPLRDLPGLNFMKHADNYKQYRCNSGACFL